MGATENFRMMAEVTGECMSKKVSGNLSVREAWLDVNSAAKTISDRDDLSKALCTYAEHLAANGSIGTYATPTVQQESLSFAQLYTLGKTATTYGQLMTDLVIKEKLASNQDKLRERPMREQELTTEGNQRIVQIANRVRIYMGLNAITAKRYETILTEPGLDTHAFYLEAAGENSPIMGIMGGMKTHHSATSSGPYQTEKIGNTDIRIHKGNLGIQEFTIKALGVSDDWKNSATTAILQFLLEVHKNSAITLQLSS